MQRLAVSLSSGDASFPGVGQPEGKRTRAGPGPYQAVDPKNQTLSLKVLSLKVSPQTTINAMISSHFCNSHISLISAEL